MSNALLIIHFSIRPSSFLICIWITSTSQTSVSSKSPQTSSNSKLNFRSKSLVQAALLKQVPSWKDEKSQADLLKVPSWKDNPMELTRFLLIQTRKTLGQKQQTSFQAERERERRKKLYWYHLLSRINGHGNVHEVLIQEWYTSFQAPSWCRFVGSQAIVQVQSFDLLSNRTEPSGH